MNKGDPTQEQIEALERAYAALKRMINNPTENDKRIIKDHTNLRIEEVPDKDCWWNFNCD